MEKTDLAQTLLTRATTEVIQKGVTCRAGEIPPPACRFCEEVCPEKAIAVTQHTIEIDKKACIQCGLCTRCPVGFLQLMEMERILPLFFKEFLKDSQEIHLRCHRILPSKWSRSGFPLPCLAYLKPSHLAYLVLNGARIVWLQHPDCTKCRLNASSLVENLKESWQKLIEIWKIPLKVEFGQKKPSGFSGYRESEELGRRDFFLQLKRNVVGRISERLPDFIIDPKPKIPHENFLYSEFLKFGPPQRVVVKRELVPWGEVELNKNCNLCGECVFVCPSKALQIEVKEGKRQLVFYPASCSQCRFCEGFCSQKGIKISPTFDFSLWGKRVVFSFED